MTTLSEGCIGVTRDGYGVNRVETTRPEGFQLERDTNENSHKNSHLFCQELCIMDENFPIKIWLKLESYYMAKSLTKKMHMK